ncbi:hypothetical protein Cgig2_012426 [Carnegiea gigantea]|uniref:non-specific serine/threonine protein kinase n=1 Tax=Carnegiea gigantea TaxID=171969 RepID=A0A9Q1KLD8_9CARY|nr:hypothetical protein Cgig2_012426 [Carnegiea gigantea]
MALFLSLHVTFLVICLLHFSIPILPVTIIMSDSTTTPSTLLDAPQTGFTMGKNGARTDTREQQAVYDIMRATGNSWVTQIPDVCQGRWHGIECMPDKDNVYHVVALSFGALSDDTAFPACDPTRSYLSESITRLPYLRTLFLYRCLTYSPQAIPSFLGRLGSLQTLVLRDNGHVGPIPNELGNLTRLRVLDLHKNNLNGSIPVSLGLITGLRSLDLSGNRLTGQIPDISFPGLNVMDLNQNLLSGPIPSSIGLSPSLLKMDFSRNRLSGPIPDLIVGLKDLVLMDLSFNLLTGPFPKSLKNLESLQALILKGNPMTSTIIPEDTFEGMKNLVILVLSNMNLQGPIPPSLTRLPKIRVVHLDGNSLNGSIPDSFRGSRSLSELRLNDNQLSGPLPFDKDMMWKMGRKLRLYNNSGLCFKHANDGDFTDDLMHWGIGYCSIPRPGLGRTVEHVKQSRENNKAWRIFSFKELLGATNNFNYDNKLGEGSFGSAYWGQLWDGSEIAVKRLKALSDKTEMFVVEIEILARVRHKNLLNLRGYCAGGQEHLIVYDFMPNLSLHSHLHRQYSTECVLDWKRRMSIAVGSAEGVAYVSLVLDSNDAYFSSSRHLAELHCLYLHRHAAPHMIHGDIKARNILLDSDFQPRVADSRLTKIISNDTADSTKEKGTLGYLAPEYMMLGRASKSSDVYSFGIVLLELVSGRIAQLTDGMNHSIIDWALPLAREGNFREIADPELGGDFNEEELRRVVLVAFMSTQKQPEKRPSMLEVVELLKGEAGDKLAKLEGGLFRNWQSAADDKDENSEDRAI